MFGKPQWFRPKSIGWGLKPVTWQGWGYTALWCAALAGPFTLLILRHQPLEALAWLAMGIAALVYDVKQILYAIQHPALPRAATAAAPTRQDDNILYILDDNQPQQAVVTRGYNLRMR